MPISSGELAARFLSAVWSINRDHHDGHDFFFLSAKDWSPDADPSTSWSEYPLSPDDHSALSGIPPNLRHLNDLYFCPNAFSEPRRLRANAVAGRWLYADLDERNPADIHRELGSLVAPTISWTTSTGRYQALWLLDRPLPPRRLERLNQQLTYYVGADKGGWSLTKVLRVPGSLSTKYRDQEPFRVRLLTGDLDSVFDATPVEDLTTLLRDVDLSPASPRSSRLPAEADLPDRDRLLSRRSIRRKLPARARQLIRATRVSQHEDRSAKLWELENLLIGAGLSPEETLVIVRGTVWNKYTGQRREVRQLWGEIQKVIASDPPPPPRDSLPSRSSSGLPPTEGGSGDALASAPILLPNTRSYRDFMAASFPKPDWLVEEVWGLGSYGMLAGEYKSFKTQLLLDLSVSVASGLPFLGRYPVRHVGPVCYIHEEGKPGAIQDRLEQVTHHKGITHSSRASDDPAQTTIIFNRSADLYEDLPIYFTSLAGLDLTDEAHQDVVFRHIRSLSPRLVVFETFYLLAGAIEDESMGEVRPVLQFLSRISQELGTAVIISHHFHKARDDKRTFDRTSGSNVWGRWYESALFVERTGEEEQNQIVIRASHRDGGTLKSKVQFLWSSAEHDYLVRFLDEEEDADDAEAAEHTIENLGRATVGQWKKATTPQDREESLQRLREMMDKANGPVPLLKIAKTLGLGRTEHAKSLAFAAGYEVATVNGVRHAFRNYEEPRSAAEGRKRSGSSRPRA